MAAAATAGAVVDIDPDWYEGQPETADEPEQGEPAAEAGAPQPQWQQEQRPPASGAASHAHVPTVLTKLQKWGDYASFGEPVGPSRFVPMKTPLSAEILATWQLPQAPRHRLTVPSLLAAQEAAGRRIGLLLDLSNHECLYTPDIPPGVDYLHVRLVAKELPPLAFVREVAAAANAFWAQHPDAYICLHCSYGFNRTGFVVCSYLIENCGLTVDAALDTFAASRPPGVKHEKFRDELRARYESGASSSSSSDGCGVAGTAPQQPPLQQQQQEPAAESQSSTAVSGLNSSSNTGAAPPSSRVSSSGGSGFVLRSSGGSGPPPLPPHLPSPGSRSRTGQAPVALSSSPAAAGGRLPVRCWSNNSVNSSIGCSPDSSALDRLVLVSSMHRADLSPAGGDGGDGCRNGQQQQRVQSLLDHQGSDAADGCGSCGGGGCGGTGYHAARQGEPEDEAEEGAAGDDTDEACCFEMDSEQQQHQDCSPVQGGQHGGQHSVSRGCCARAAPCCTSSSIQQEEPGVDPTSIHKHQRPPVVAPCCSCSCHQLEAQAVQLASLMQGGGSSHVDAGSSPPRSHQRLQQQQRRGSGGSGDEDSAPGGAGGLLENESFGCSADLLLNLRTLMHANASQQQQQQQ